MFEQVRKVACGVVYFIGEFFKSIVSSAERMESGACRVAMNSALYSLEHKEGVNEIEDIKSWEVVITRARRLLAENPVDDKIS